MAKCMLMVEVGTKISSAQSIASCSAAVHDSSDYKLRIHLQYILDGECLALLLGCRRRVSGSYRRQQRVRRPS